MMGKLNLPFAFGALKECARGSIGWSRHHMPDWYRSQLTKMLLEIDRRDVSVSADDAKSMQWEFDKVKK
jgi:hypothetical protein